MHVDGLYALERELWENWRGIQLTGILDQLRLEHEDEETGERKTVLDLVPREMLALRFEGPHQDYYGRPHALVPVASGVLDSPRWHEMIGINMVAEAMETMYRDTLEEEQCLDRIVVEVRRYLAQRHRSRGRRRP